MYLTKASMVVNACQHTMPVGTIQTPCFRDSFSFQVHWLNLYFFRMTWAPHTSCFWIRQKWVMLIQKHVKTLMRSFCIPNLNSMLILFVAWLSWPLLAFSLSRLVLFHHVVCVYMFMCMLCVYVSAHACWHTCTRFVCVCVDYLINFCIGTSL